ncbi:cytochrome P450 CYP12A2-like isoform X2 [Haematobia irritans]|uniref:cytochrome P450 CYP12A2-like isoform X2 n=1 Tax=Haematobia irritans TaxID=7368 RepID=UPI003F4F7308
MPIVPIYNQFTIDRQRNKVKNIVNNKNRMLKINKISGTVKTLINLNRQLIIRQTLATTSVAHQQQQQQDEQPIQQYGRIQSRRDDNERPKNNEENTTSANEEWLNAKPLDEMPTISPIKLLKNFLPGGRYHGLDSAQLMLAFKEDLGGIGLVKGVFGKPDTVLCHDPLDFEKVYRNEGVWPTRPGMEILYHYRHVIRKDFFQGVEGLSGTQGEKWGLFRSTVNPILMQPKNVRVYFHKMSQVNKEFIERIREIRDPHSLEVPRNFEEEMNRWTLESVSVVALDKQLGLIGRNRNNPEAKLLFKSLTELFVYSMELELKPSIWKYYTTPTMKKVIESLDHITEITKTYIEEAIERIENEEKSGRPEKPENEKSVLEKLVKIDKKIAMVMAMDMLMAGVDTTSSTFTGLLLCLAKNPAKQAKLRQEVRKLLPNKDSEFDETVFQNMPYLKACIKESLRMYPLTLGNTRVPINDVVLQGYRVPKGTQVIMISTSLMKNEKHYPRGNEYLPERWLRPSKQEEEAGQLGTGECPVALKPSSPFIYLPFGFGSRSCIGRRIVEMELEMGIARVIRNFHVDFNYSTENAFKCVLINVPNIPLKFKFSDVKD